MGYIWACAEGDVFFEVDIAEYLRVGRVGEEFCHAVKADHVPPLTEFGDAFADFVVGEHDDGGGGNPVFLDAEFRIGDFSGGDEEIGRASCRERV